MTPLVYLCVLFIKLQSSKIRKALVKRQLSIINSQTVKDNIDGEHVRFIHEQLNIQPQTKYTLEQYTREFEKLFKSASDKTFIYETPKQFRCNKQPWFSPQAMKQYHRAKSHYHNSPNYINKLRLKKASTFYKSTLFFYVNTYRYKNASKLRSLRSESPTLYWNSLNNISP